MPTSAKRLVKKVLMLKVIGIFCKELCLGLQAEVVDGQKTQVWE